MIGLTLDLCGAFCVRNLTRAVILGFVSSILSQETGRETFLRNDLFYVEWDVTTYYGRPM